MFSYFGRGAIAVFLALGVFATSGCAGRDVPADARGLTRGEQIDLAEYRAILIEPVTVAFDKRWKPVQTGSHLEMSRSDRERLEREIASLFDETFREELVRGNLRMAERPGPGVLRVTPELIDVYMNAPAPMSQPGATFTRSVGNLTLHLTFHDAATGEQVLELHDRVRGRDIGLLRPASPVYNRFELERIFEDWAQVVRQDLFMQP